MRRQSCDWLRDRTAADARRRALSAASWRMRRWFPGEKALLAAELSDVVAATTPPVPPGAGTPLPKAPKRSRWLAPVAAWMLRRLDRAAAAVAVAMTRSGAESGGGSRPDGIGRGSRSGAARIYEMLTAKLWLTILQNRVEEAYVCSQDTSRLAGDSCYEIAGGTCCYPSARGAETFSAATVRGLGCLEIWICAFATRCRRQ